MKGQYTVNADAGLLQVDYDQELLQTVSLALRSLKDQRNVVLKNAINATVKYAYNSLTDKAQATYTAKKGALRKATTKKNATNSRLEGEIDVKGGTLEVSEFKSSAPRSGAKAQILKSENLKLIQSQKGGRAKAFLATFSSGHTAIVQRQEGQEYRRDKAKRQAKYGPHIDVTRIKKLLSLSFPKMVGGSKVLSEVAPDIYDHLMDNVRAELQRVINA